MKALALRVLFGKKTTAWVVSRDNADYWRRYGVSRQEFVDFESPVPVSAADEQAAAEIRRTHLGSNGGALVLSVGRVVAAKGVADLDAAVEVLRDRGLKVAAVMVGPHDSGDAAALSQVQLVGAMSRDELAKFYLAADVFVLASHGEAYGLVVREALQFGVPVVATSRVPSARALCGRGWNIVDPRDPIALAAAIERALDEPHWEPLAVRPTMPFYAAQLGTRDVE